LNPYGTTAAQQPAPVIADYALGLTVFPTFREGGLMTIYSMAAALKLAGNAGIG
jgi:hypothetical protein